MRSKMASKVEGAASGLPLPAVQMSMNNAAINGLCLDDSTLARATSGFQVVSVHQGCTQHNGLFFDPALASEYAAALDAGAAAEGNPNRYVVKAWKKSSRRR